jgi:hypothetical protein
VPGLLSIGFAASTNLIPWHSLLLCLQISKLNPQFSFIHNEFLAVGAVIGELVSVAPFPCFAGKYREICRIQNWRRRSASAFGVEIQPLASRIP